ncbi:MAG TPA: hypothetical protein VGV93_08070 [Acidimicrobiales bacterium]|nr:hypothetical protein [Acidimicrobiales bacterium]
MVLLRRKEWALTPSGGRCFTFAARIHSLTILEMVPAAASTS